MVEDFLLESRSDMKGRVLPSQAFFNLSSNSRKHNEEQKHLVPKQITTLRPMKQKLLPIGCMMLFVDVSVSHLIAYDEIASFHSVNLILCTSTVTGEQFLLHNVTEVTRSASMSSSRPLFVIKCRDGLSRSPHFRPLHFQRCPSKASPYRNLQQSPANRPTEAE